MYDLFNVRFISTEPRSFHERQVNQDQTESSSDKTDDVIDEFNRQTAAPKCSSSVSNELESEIVAAVAMCSTTADDIVDLREDSDTIPPTSTPKDGSFHRTAFHSYSSFEIIEIIQLMGLDV